MSASEENDRFQFTLTSAMLLVAASAGYFWLIKYPEYGAPLVLVFGPLLVAVGLVLWQVSWDRWLGIFFRAPRSRGRRESAAAPPALPVPEAAFQLFDPVERAEPAGSNPLAAKLGETAMHGQKTMSHIPGVLGSLRIEAIEVRVVNLPCKATFLLAGGAYSQQGQPTPRALVKVVGSNGMAGWGEVTPCPTWCYETSETITSTIRKYLAPGLLGLPAWDRDALHRRMDRLINPGATIGQPLAKSGIDVAVHDLIARTLGVPLYVLLGGKRLDVIPLSYIVSAHGPDEAAQQARNGLELGYSAFKIKVGMHGAERDLAIVEAVQQLAPQGAFLWIDANQGYTLDTAVRQAKRFAELGVAALEQPLRGSRPSEFRRLVELGAVPIAIDESLCSPTDLIEYIKAGAVDLPVAKVQRCGGLWWSRSFCQIAESAGLRLLGSGLCETDLGLATGVHLFAAFGIDSPCDLNGRQFVESAYLRETIQVADGEVVVPDRPGIGVEVDEALVAQFDAGI